MAPRRAKTGRNLAYIFRKLGYPPEACQGCTELAKTMDAQGPDWCAQNRDYILGEMEANAVELGVVWRPREAGLLLDTVILFSKTVAALAPGSHNDDEPPPSTGA